MLAQGVRFSRFQEKPDILIWGGGGGGGKEMVVGISNFVNSGSKFKILSMD